MILLPTTCGTGSEVTNISVLLFPERKTKFGLADQVLYADEAVLIPELLEELPWRFFVTSAIDAFIHATESYTSPKANGFTQIFSEKAIELQIKGFRHIIQNGQESRKDVLESFLMASCYAGIAFGNAGCAAVHALSFPLGGNYHVPHGEANYVFFTKVYEKYMALDGKGSIRQLNAFLACMLDCSQQDVYQEIEAMLGQLLQKKTLKEYGMSVDEIDTFTDSVIEKQQRLLKNNYTALSRADIRSIYADLYDTK